MDVDNTAPHDPVTNTSLHSLHPDNVTLCEADNSTANPDIGLVASGTILLSQVTPALRYKVLTSHFRPSKDFQLLIA